MPPPVDAVDEVDAALSAGGGATTGTSTVTVDVEEPGAAAQEAEATAADAAAAAAAVSALGRSETDRRAWRSMILHGYGFFLSHAMCCCRKRPARESLSRRPQASHTERAGRGRGTYE